MKSRSLIPWISFLLVVGLSACVGDGSPDGVSSQLQAIEANVCVSGTPEYDPTDPRCVVGGPGGTGVSPPAVCVGGSPTCNRAQDYPTQADLTITNSQNLAFSAVTGGIRLLPGSASLVDADGDGVPDDADECAGPGWRIPCDGDASNDGIYQTTYFDSGGAVTVGADVSVDGTISAADAYILMDATGSMVGEQAQLVTDLTTGTFVDPVACPTGSGTGLAGGLGCVVDDIRMGLGQFNEVPLAPYGHPFGYSPFHHHLDITDNLQHLLDAVSALTVRFNKDAPEAATQALYSVVTGEGLGPWVPNRAGCPAGHWGYPCFRPGALPIIILFTDDQMYNGPRAASPTYGNPPFDGTVGLSTLLPPVIQDPGMIYSSNVLSAHDFGDLTTTSLTAMGTNANFGNDVTTWTFGACTNCPGSGCWGDGLDGIVNFSLSSAVPSVFVSGEGTFYPNTNLAVIDSGLNMLDCNPGPGGGDYWGRITMPLAAGDWYIASDAAVSPSSSVADTRGPFQIRIQTTATDPSWATRELPIPWTDVETELLARAVKLVQIDSPGSGDNAAATADMNALAVATGSVDQFGQPYREAIAGDGTGLSTAVLDAVRALVGDTRRDISIIAEDNAATAGVDESQFVNLITATQCPTTGINNCTGGVGTDTCQGCLAGSDLQFEFRLGNDFLAPTAVAQVFEFDLVALADGSVELNRIPVRVMVPPAGAQFGSGHYQNSYDADYVCEMPPERPDWGILTWSGSTPSDSKIEFELFTANTLAELDNQIPTSIVIPDDTTATEIDVGTALVADGQLNYLPFLRVRAKLQASTDFLTTPELDGWTMQFDCVPFD